MMCMKCRSEGPLSNLLKHSLWLEVAHSWTAACPNVVISQSCRHTVKLLHSCPKHAQAAILVVVVCSSWLCAPVGLA